MRGCLLCLALILLVSCTTSPTVQPTKRGPIVPTRVIPSATPTDTQTNIPAATSTFTATTIPTLTATNSSNADFHDDRNNRRIEHANGDRYRITDRDNSTANTDGHGDTYRYSAAQRDAARNPHTDPRADCRRADLLSQFNVAGADHPDGIAEPGRYRFQHH